MLALIGTPEATAADADRGQALSAQCVACHGPRGVSSHPLFPHLAGQPAGYLQRQLEAFRNGERHHPLMMPIAESLTTEDIDDLAAHYSRLGPLANGTRDARRQAPVPAD